MYYATVDVTRRPKGYVEALKKFLELPFINNVVPVEFGHPNDLTQVLARVGAQIRKGGDINMLAHRYLPQEEQMRLLRMHDHQRQCAVLIDPVFEETTVTFRILPTGQYGEVLKRMLDEGREFIPGSRALQTGYRNDLRIHEIVGIDLVPREHHVDTGSDVCLPFVKVN